MQLFLFQIIITDVTAGFQWDPTRMKRNLTSPKSTRRTLDQEGIRSDIGTTTKDNRSLSSGLVRGIPTACHDRKCDEVFFDFRKVLHQMSAREDSHSQARSRWCAGRNSAANFMQRKTDLEITVRTGNAVQQEASLYLAAWLTFLHWSNS